MDIRIAFLHIMHASIFGIPFLSFPRRPGIVLQRKPGPVN